MTAEPRAVSAGATTPQLSRRTLLKRAAALGFSGSALAAFLGACGTVTTITEVAVTAVSGSGAAPTVAATATQVATIVPGGIVATAQAAATNPAGAATAVSSAVGAASPATGGTPAFGGTFDGTILFGAAVSLTGNTASEGKLTQDGYELWKETYNSAGGITVAGKRYKIETKYYDDESNGPKSATLATQLIKQDKVQFLLGPYGTTSTLQVSTVAEQNKIR